MHPAIDKATISTIEQRLEEKPIYNAVYLALPKNEKEEFFYHFLDEWGCFTLNLEAVDQTSLLNSLEYLPEEFLEFLYRNSRTRQIWRILSQQEEIADQITDNQALYKDLAHLLSTFLHHTDEGIPLPDFKSPLSYFRRLIQDSLNSLNDLIEKETF